MVRTVVLAVVNYAVASLVEVLPTFLAYVMDSVDALRYTTGFQFNRKVTFLALGGPGTRNAMFCRNVLSK